MKYLIVGLGNIGQEYLLTRHNIGFLIADHLAAQANESFSLERLAYRASIKHKGRSLEIIKPTTYMNLSGKAVQHWLSVLKIPVENMLVLVDDLALPFAKIRVREKGSAAGHNGLRDIEATLQSQNYARLRFGIGDNFPKGKQADYVLSNFSKDEQAELPLKIEQAAKIVESFCTLGIAQTMNFFNK